ncbi:hypothetical protein [Flectobacillus roseus]|uniref:hypothetical protein n=1 Tax=Flectobacillus roseus TaxID=502259 RepID=UPI0024B81796|nr:hypothetical protein [Flectobacillus roseus]MDI9872499.1 hypothetical protein [Flectobacillus roseus]
MKKFSLAVLAIFIANCFPISSISQAQTLPWSIGVKTGFGSIIGDGQAFTGSLTYGMFIEKRMTEKFSLNASFDFGSIATNAYSGYTYTGQTSFFQTAVLAKYQLGKGEGKKPTFSPFVGLGVIAYNPKVSQNGTVIRYADGTASSPEGVNDLIIPFGFEVGFKLSEKAKLSFVAQSGFAFTDRLNGTVGVSNPSASMPDGHKFVGKISDVSGASSNDFTSFLGLKLGFSIGDKTDK